MKPWKTLATEPSPDGKALVLQERDGIYVIRVGGHELMSSAQHGSEEAMAQAALEGLGAAPRVLVGGLGLGYPLRATLDRLPAEASVTVVEISRAVVEWNRGLLAALARSPLSDPRVSVEIADIGRFLGTAADRFDTILLDVDNGPSALSHESNQALYGSRGLGRLLRALHSGGTLVVWSAGAAPAFLERLRNTGFEVEERRVPVRPGSGKAHHVLIIGRRRDGVPSLRQQPSSRQSAGRTRPRAARVRGPGSATRRR